MSRRLRAPSKEHVAALIAAAKDGDATRFTGLLQARPELSHAHVYYATPGSNTKGNFIYHLIEECESAAQQGKPTEPYEAMLTAFIRAGGKLLSDRYHPLHALSYATRRHCVSAMRVLLKEAPQLLTTFDVSSDNGKKILCPLDELISSRPLKIESVVGGKLIPDVKRAEQDAHDSQELLLGAMDMNADAGGGLLPLQYALSQSIYDKQWHWFDRMIRHGASTQAVVPATGLPLPLHAVHDLGKGQNVLAEMLIAWGADMHVEDRATGESALEKIRCLAERADSASVENQSKSALRNYENAMRSTRYYFENGYNRAKFLSEDAHGRPMATMQARVLAEHGALDELLRADVLAKSGLCFAQAKALVEEVLALVSPGQRSRFDGTILHREDELARPEDTATVTCLRGNTLLKIR